MALSVDEVYQAGLELDVDERTVVAHRLLDSLHTEDAEIDAAWREEIGRRVDDVLTGRVALGSFEATREKFAAAHPPPTP